MMGRASILIAQFAPGLNANAFDPALGGLEDSRNQSAS